MDTKNQQQFSEQQKRKLLAAAEIVDKGQFAVLEKILEFQDFLEEWEEEIEKLKDEIRTTLPTEIHDKLDVVSIELQSKIDELATTKVDMEKMMSDEYEDMEKHEKMMVKMQSDMGSMFKTLKNGIEEVKDLIPEMPESFDPTDIIKRINEIETKIPEKVDLTGMETDIKEIKEEIREVKKDIEELKKRPIYTGGGGVSALAVARSFKYIFHTEEPVGLINGSNVTYTVKNNIWAIIGFTLNGEQIAELPNYTFINHTITFASALPSAYSGKDFECKYIGS